MVYRDIIVIGASAGGIEALQPLVASLPRDFPATLFVVSHLSPDSRSALPQILQRAGVLPAVEATDGAAFRPGQIYVAPPDHHLLLEDSQLRLTRGPKENRFRPAIDPLFRSAAYHFGPRVIGVILSGALDDGTAGLWTIKDRGGLALVQDPAEAQVASMPESALAHVAVDATLSVSEMGALLLRWTREPLTHKGEPPVSESLAIEMKIAQADNALHSGVTQLGERSLYTCPECHGVLTQLQEGSIVRFRCHTGHAYSMETLLAEIAEHMEQSLWSTVRVFEEGELLLQQMAQQLPPDAPGAQPLTQKAHAVEAQLQQLRQLVLTHERVTKDTLQPKRRHPDASVARR